MLKSKKTNRVFFKDKRAKLKLEKIITKNLYELNYNSSKNLIIVCVGTDRSTGDSLGPLTGSILERRVKNRVDIWGNINNPVHAKNLDKTIQKIRQTNTFPFIIAIDAGLGKKSSIGAIDVKKGPLKPGTGVNKKLTKIGDMHITALVNVGGYMEYLVLQSTRLSVVIKMANIIANALELCVDKLEKNTKIVD
ncbi:MAG: spore protease YyaC [Bacillota bacterium]